MCLGSSGRCCCSCCEGGWVLEESGVCGVRWRRLKEVDISAGGQSEALIRWDNVRSGDDGGCEDWVEVCSENVVVDLVFENGLGMSSCKR